MTIFTVDAKSFAAALARVLPFSCTDTFHELEAVQLRRSGDRLVLSTTDRFRAAMLVTAVEWADGVGEDWALVLPREVAKRAVTEWKSARLCQLTLETDFAEGDKRRVVIQDALGRSIGDTFTEAKFPDLSKVITKHDVSSDPPKDQWVMFNADYLVDFAKTRPHKNSPMEVRWPERPSQPIHVAIGDDFLGVLMPQRRPNGSLVSELLKHAGGEA